MTFGVNDRVRVHLNDHLLYAGDDDVVSRDYRFSGAISFPDALNLPLKKAAMSCSWQSRKSRELGRCCGKISTPAIK